MQAFDISKSVLVNIDFTIWTGKAKLDANDIPDAANHMPPKSICTAGAIKIFDTDELKQFRNFRTRAENSAASYGCKCLGGWLVSEDILPILEEELGSCHSDWANALGEFIQAYPQKAHEWAQSWGQWDALIRQKQPAVSELCHKFDFTWQTFKLTAETANASSKGNNTDDIVKSIPDAALQSVIDSLKALYDMSFDKQGDPSPKAYYALAKIARRARALGFANPNAARLVPVLTDLCNRKDHVLSRLVLSRMDNPQAVLDVLQVVAGQGIDSLLTPTEIIPLSPTALEEEKRKQSVDNLLDQATSLLNGTDSVVDDKRTPNEPVVLAGEEMARCQLIRCKNGQITLEEYNEWMQDAYSQKLIHRNVFCELMGAAGLALPEEVPAPQVSASDILDSLGLF